MDLVSGAETLFLSFGTCILAAACANYYTPGASIPQGRGVTIGGQQGSILPAGQNWKLVLEDKFDGPTLNTAIWQDWVPPGNPDPPGVAYEDNTRAVSFLNGHMFIRHWDASDSPGNTNNLPGAGGIVSKQTYGPGYYEVRIKPGDGWNTFWIIAKMNSNDCSGLATNGFEADIFEGLTPGGQHAVHWNGYGGCHEQITHALSLSQSQFYVIGSLWSTQTGLTFYINGEPTWNVPEAVGTNPVTILLTGGVHGTNPMEVDWVRYYTDEEPLRTGRQ